MGINTFNDRQKTKAIVVEGIIIGTAELPKCSNLYKLSPFGIRHGEASSAYHCVCINDLYFDFVEFLNIFYLKCFWLDISSLDHFNFQMVGVRFNV